METRTLLARTTSVDVDECEVAHVFVGQTATGQTVAVWDVDIGT